MAAGMAYIGKGGWGAYELAATLDIPLTEYWAKEGQSSIEGHAVKAHEAVAECSMAAHAAAARQRSLDRLGLDDAPGLVVPVAVSMDMGWETRGFKANSGSSEAMDDGR
eukprot:SAG31_NODE_28889_length_404_cov_0.508197_1_plen_108_part_10